MATQNNKSSITLGSIVGFVMLTAALLIGRYLYTQRDAITGSVAVLFSDVTVCDRDDWQTFVSTPGDFSILLPCVPEPHAYETGGDQPLPGHYYQVRAGTGDEYGVAYLDISQALDGSGFEFDADAMLWELRKELVKETESELLHKRPIGLGTHPGREYWMQQGTGTFVFWRTYFAEPTFYILAVETERQNEPSDIHRSFLASFELLDDVVMEEQRQEQRRRESEQDQRRQLDELLAERAREDAQRRERIRKAEAAERERIRQSGDAFIDSQKSFDWYNNPR